MSNLSKKDLKFCNMLFGIAKDLYSTKEFRSKHAAAVVYKNKIVSIGTNRLKTDPFNLQFTDNPEKVYIHAETDAIKQAVQMIGKEIENATLYVVRAAKLDTLNYELAESKPCQMCSSAIEHFNICRVVYSINKGLCRL